MIYFTTFILTLLLSHIARATPACGVVTSPEELYDPTYTDAQRDQHSLPPIWYNVTWAGKYDNQYFNTRNVACSDLSKQYPYFKDFPRFPFIGGASFIKKGSDLCGTCWNLTNPRTGKTISIAAIDSASQIDRFNISQRSFNTLNGEKPGQWLLAIVTKVRGYHCGFESK